MALGRLKPCEACARTGAAPIRLARYRDGSVWEIVAVCRECEGSGEVWDLGPGDAAPTSEIGGAG